MRKELFWALVVCITCIWLSSTVFAQPKTIKLGWVGPLTGPAAEAGIADKQGCTLALEEWNSKGGVYVAEYKSKCPVEIIFEDAQAKPEIGVSVAEKLITKDKVHFLFGDAFSSSVTMAVMELAPKYGIPIMSIESVSEEIGKKVAKDPQRYWNFWKTAYGSTAYGKNIFYSYKYLIDQKALAPVNKSLAFVIEDTDYGRSNAAQAKDLFEGIGWKSVAVETVPLGYTDFYPQLSKIKALVPDVLVTCFTSVSSGVAAVKQFQEVGLKSSHMALYYPSRPEFMKQAGKFSDYSLWIMAAYFDPENIPRQKEFAEKVRKRWNATANIDMAFGYDGVNVALNSIEKAGSLEPKKIVGALSKLDERVLLGRYVFDQTTHQLKDGPEFFPLPAAQIIGEKSYIFWPGAGPLKNYVVPPWMK